MRRIFLHTLVLFGLALVTITELLSLFSLIRPIPLVLCWAVVLIFLGRHLRPSLPRPHADPVILTAALSIAIILTLTAVTAAFSPPNSADAMLQPLAEYMIWLR